MESYLDDSMWDRQVRRVRCISPYSHDCWSWEASILAPQSSPFIAFDKRGEASNPLNNSTRRNSPEALLSRLVKGRKGGGADAGVMGWRAFACLPAGASVGRRPYVTAREAGRSSSVVAGAASRGRVSLSGSGWSGSGWSGCGEA